LFTTWVVDHVYADPCHWQGTGVPVGTSAELAEAIARQPGRTVSAPQSVSLGGTTATLIVASAPTSLNDQACDDGIYVYWPGINGDESEGWRSAPGQTDSIYLIDTPDGPLVITATLMPNASQTDKDELAALVDSIQIGAE